VQLIDQFPRPGAHETRVAFLHPKALKGVLIEIAEKDKV
jgi:methylmalonyl-CoA/ethylmalonyl-CoA epimerase